MTFYDIRTTLDNVMKMNDFKIILLVKIFKMTGILIELFLSWLLLKIVEKTSLSALGLQPTRRRIKDLAIGILLTAPFLIAFSTGVAILISNPYHLNPHYTFKDFLTATGYVFRAAVYEDLIFRGALLYILIRRLGPRKGMLISAIAFGIYHWFSWGVLGQPVQMLIVFAMTGVAGYIFAMAYERTGSLYLPFALHFGMDFAAMVILSQDKGIGLQLLSKTFMTDPISPGPVVSLLVILIHFTWFPILGFLYFRYMHRSSASVRPLLRS
jgi:membrane protease YdiL (CAAX protease family)